MKTSFKAVGLMATASLVGCTGGDADEATGQADHSVMVGAGFTTFDDALGGCKNGGPTPNGVNCNNYLGKAYVYMSGGPEQDVSGLADGSYFFAVLTPGSQNAGFIDGATGNLSDTTAGGTAGDLGSGDDVSNRTFTITGHDISSYLGTHATGFAPNGRPIIGLAPFDDTDNPGGVYILAICQTGATAPSQCKYDAFRIKDTGEDPGPEFPIVSGGKYYDANINGKWDAGEAGIAGWVIDYHDGVSGVVITGGDGTFTQMLIADSYELAERQPAGSAWHQTGNTVDQTATTGGATATLNGDKTYSIVVADDTTVSGLFFGNVCVGAGGGHTIGFWSNKNGQALIDAGDLAALVALNLRSWTGAAFDPATKAAYRSWLLNATATNMAYMLSAQLSATVLNIRNGLVASGAIVYAPGTTSADANGFAILTALIAEADATLAVNGFVVDGNPERAHQEALKDAFDDANNNLNFLQASQETCPAPVFE